MKKELAFVILMFALIASVSAVGVNGAINISRCQIISSPGNYNLITNLSSSERCIEIKADNVNFNGNGYKILGLGGIRDYGVFSDSQKNVSIRNTVVENFDSGIKIVACSNCYVGNNIVRNSTNGIILTTSRNSKVVNNTVEYNTYGIKLATSSFDSSSLNLIRNNTYGLYLGVNSYYNEFNADQIIGNVYGVSLKSSSNNNFRNGVIWGSIEQEIVLDFGSTGNSFINMSYNTNKQDIEAGSNLMRIWYLETDVLDSGQNPLDNADVSVLNGDGKKVFSGSTNENGTVTTELTDYTDNGRRKIYEDFYLVSASKENYTQNNSFVDISNNTRVFLTLTGIANNSSNSGVFNLRTSPGLPFENNKQEQIIQLWFNSSAFPINVSVTFRSAGFAKREDYYINGTDMLPISFTIPSGLNDGNYNLLFESIDSNGSKKSVNLGNISVVTPVSAPSGGGGGGGGGGGSTSSGGGIISTSSSNVSNTGNATAPQNQSYGNFTADFGGVQNEGPGGISALTGAVIGALKRNVWVVVVFIAAIIIAFLILSNRNTEEEKKKGTNGKKTNGEKVNGKNGNGKAV